MRPSGTQVTNEPDHGRSCGLGPDKNLWINTHLRLFRILYFPLLIPDVEPFRGRHHGQFRLPHARFFHSGGSSSGRVYPNMGRVRSQCNVRDFI